MNKRFSNASSRDCAPEDDDETAAMVTSGNDEEEHQQQQHQGEEEEEEVKPSSRGAAQCQQQKKRTSKTGEAEEEEGEELIQQEDDLQSVESQNENCRADFCLDRHDHQQNGNAADDDECCDQEKLKLIEQQETMTTAEAPLEAKGRPRPAMLQIHTVQPYQSAEKVKSPAPNAAADEAFLGQMREKKKVAGLIARFNAFAPTAAPAVNNENAAGGGGSNSKKIGGAEPGKVGELRQKFN
ncbi:hypothetical protein niasHT_008484 [Heterodera trifolii]|uniref:Uncharacterized protein n=1 Tax=Heterodera trifolii TaxID=157864 RepID=A0ABD2M5P4_9BILA